MFTKDSISTVLLHKFSYVQVTPEELHLRIRNISMDDDGTFQCQVVEPGGKLLLRANASIEVLGW
jgi:hypothetical protein